MNQDRAVPQLHWLEGNRHVITPLVAPDSRQEKQSALFLDRDGVINKDVNFLGDPSQLILLPGAPEAIRLLQERFVVIVVTNQSGIARGMFTEDNLFAVHTEMASKLTAEEVRLDAFYYCPHHPTGTVSEYSVECQCRKPSPGMLAAAAQDYNIDLGSSFLVGDTPRDVQAAVAVGVIGIKVGELDGLPNGTPTVDSLLAAASQIQETVQDSASIKS